MGAATRVVGVASATARLAADSPHPRSLAAWPTSLTVAMVDREDNAAPETWELVLFCFCFVFLPKKVGPFPLLVCLASRAMPAAERHHWRRTRATSTCTPGQRHRIG